MTLKHLIDGKEVTAEAAEKKLAKVESGEIEPVEYSTEDTEGQDTKTARERRMVRSLLTGPATLANITDRMNAVTELYKLKSMTQAEVKAILEEAEGVSGEGRGGERTYRLQEA